MTELLIIRHGETAWNTEEIFRGRADIGLSDIGLLQAKLLAEYLRDTPVEAVYSSPLKRAVTTAEGIAGTHGLKVQTEYDLIDIDYGEWQGMSLQEVGKIYNTLYIKWLQEPQNTAIPGGETLEKVRKRAVRVIEEILTKHSGTVVVIAHRVVNKVLICALLGLDNSHFWNIRQDTCGITKFGYRNGQYVLISHNDTSFQKSVSGTGMNDF